MGEGKRNKGKYLKQTAKGRSEFWGPLIVVLCVAVVGLGVMAFLMSGRDGKPPVNENAVHVQNPVKETLGGNINETEAQEETEIINVTEEQESQDTTSDVTQDEVGIVDAYVNDESHLIYIMSDGTEVDAGVMGMDSADVPEYTVTFMDYDATILATESVKNGGDATPPTVPPRAGYNFAGWNGSYANITADVTLVAQYQQQEADVKTYAVSFVDHNGNILRTEIVEEGKNASAPAEPNREGYAFVGWDKTFDKITSDLTVTAQYNPIIRPAVVVDTVEAVAGQSEIAVKIAIKNNPGISSMKLVVTYDRNLVLEKVTYDVVGGITQAPQKLESPVILNWANPMENATGDWNFATMTFAVSEEASGELPIKVHYDADDVYNMSETNIYFEVVNGAIIVK